MHHLPFTHHGSENKISKNYPSVTYNVNKREIRTSYPILKYCVKKRKVYTSYCLLTYVNKREYASNTLLAYADKRKVCTTQPLLTYHVDNREVYTSYPLGKRAPPTLYWCIMPTIGNYTTVTLYWHIVSTRQKYAPATLYWHAMWHESFTCLYHGCKHREFQYIYKFSLTAVNKCQCSHWYSNWWLDETITDCP